MKDIHMSLKYNKIIFNSLKIYFFCFTSLDNDMRYLRVRGRNSNALYRLFKLKFSPIIDNNFNIIFNMIVLIYL